MATTATLEAYLDDTQTTVTVSPGLRVYRRSFKVPQKLIDTLAPTVGDTLSTDSSQRVVHAGEVTKAQGLYAWMAVVYAKPVASGSPF